MKFFSETYAAVHRMVLFFFLIHLTHQSFAFVFLLPQSGNLVGKTRVAHSRVGETLEEVGRRFHIGYVEMVRANPKQDPHQILPNHTKLVIPSQFRLPKGPRQGIVINLADFRLFYYPPDEPVVWTFPVGIGRDGWNTPLGVTQITAKIVNPYWRPTTKILEAAKQRGAPLPKEVPPGPYNPLGTRALRLGWKAVLIHGTNPQASIGTKASAGCIRMQYEDIEYLFDMVHVGTSVRVIEEKT